MHEEYQDDPSENKIDSSDETDDNEHEFNYISDDDCSSVDSDDCFIDSKEFFSKSSNTTILDFYMAIYSIKIKHHLSDQAIKDIIKCCQLIIPEKKKAKVSLRSIERALLIGEKGSFFSSCLSCETIADEKELLDFKESKKKCPNCPGDLVDFFCFDVKSQIEKILQKAGIVDQLKKAKVRALSRTGNEINSQLDGSIYQKYIAQVKTSNDLGKEQSPIH